MGRSGIYLIHFFFCDVVLLNKRDWSFWLSAKRLQLDGFLLISNLFQLPKYAGHFFSFHHYRQWSPFPNPPSRPLPPIPSSFLLLSIDSRVAFAHADIIIIIILSWFWEAQPRLQPLSSSPFPKKFNSKKSPLGATGSSEQPLPQLSTQQLAIISTAFRCHSA